MPIQVGLTGGIGSGKTTVAKLFEEIGIPVFYSDDEAKMLYENPEVQHQINEIVNENLFEHGILDKKRLAEFIFSDPEIRTKINAIIHPKVREKFSHFHDSYLDVPYIINEAAILFETGAYKRFQQNILVVAPEQIRIERVKLRDHITEDDVRERIQSQWTDEQKIPLADFIITNDGVHSLKEQVMEIDAKLKEL